MPPELCNSTVRIIKSTSTWANARMVSFLGVCFPVISPHKYRILLKRRMPAQMYMDWACAWASTGKTQVPVKPAVTIKSTAIQRNLINQSNCSERTSTADWLGLSISLSIILGCAAIFFRVRCCRKNPLRFDSLVTLYHIRSYKVFSIVKTKKPSHFILCYNTNIYC